MTIQPPFASSVAAVDPTDTDLALYQAIAARVAAGEDYHGAAVAEQRARDYPLRPIFTVRLPTLAWTVGTLGPESAALLLKLLMIAAIAALTLRLRSLAGSRAAWGVASLLGAGSMALLTVPAMTFWHESWAALLIVLSITLRSSGRWMAALLFGLIAVLVRELALPFLCVMAALAWREGNRVEAGAWAAAILIFFLVMAAHAAALAGYVTGEDPASPGWSGAGGWLFVLAMVQRCTLFLSLPLPVIAMLVPLALLGWAGLTGATGERIALLLIGYLAGFMLLGRPDNFYWGILIAPLLPGGLAFAPRALRDLVRCTEILNRRHNRVVG
ncbi:MAG: hypothetical protein M3N39_14090, partial [Pseudomonadota bacterium]|nr:hypothetical protein [Pseudomonadota bacterium]